MVDCLYCRQQGLSQGLSYKHLKIKHNKSVSDYKRDFGLKPENPIIPSHHKSVTKVNKKRKGTKYTKRGELTDSKTRLLIAVGIGYNSKDSISKNFNEIYEHISIKPNYYYTIFNKKVTCLKAKLDYKEYDLIINQANQIRINWDSLVDYIIDRIRSSAEQKIKIEGNQLNTIKQIKEKITGRRDEYLDKINRLVAKAKKDKINQDFYIKRIKELRVIIQGLSSRLEAPKDRVKHKLYHRYTSNKEELREFANAYEYHFNKIKESTRFNFSDNLKNLIKQNLENYFLNIASMCSKEDIKFNDIINTYLEVLEGSLLFSNRLQPKNPQVYQEFLTLKSLIKYIDIVNMNRTNTAHSTLRFVIAITMQDLNNIMFVEPSYAENMFIESSPLAEMYELEYRNKLQEDLNKIRKKLGMEVMPQSK